MTRQFSKVSPALWGSKRFSALSDAAKILYLYLLTNEHMNSAGAYRLKKGYALADLVWPADIYNANLAALQAAELVAYDPEFETVYVLRWFKHNPPMNDKHALGCRRIILELDSEAIAELAMTDFEEVDSRRNPPQAPARQLVSPRCNRNLLPEGADFETPPIRYPDPMHIQRQRLETETSDQTPNQTKTKT